MSVDRIIYPRRLNDKSAWIAGISEGWNGGAPESDLTYLVSIDRFEMDPRLLTGVLECRHEQRLCARSNRSGWSTNGPGSSYPRRLCYPLVLTYSTKWHASAATDPARRDSHVLFPRNFPTQCRSRHIPGADRSEPWSLIQQMCSTNRPQMNRYYCHSTVTFVLCMIVEVVMTDSGDADSLDGARYGTFGSDLFALIMPPYIA